MRYQNWIKVMNETPHEKQGGDHDEGKQVVVFCHFYLVRVLSSIHALNKPIVVFGEYGL